MKLSKAINVFTKTDRKGRYVYTVRDLSKLFPEDNERSLKAGIGRLVVAGILERAVKGVYVYALSAHVGSDTLELVAKAMRRGEYSYVSLETALSEYGVISQIPMDRLTIMTTGRTGEYHTPYGVIEFTHTSRPIGAILDSMVSIGRPLRMAGAKAALRDLARVGRNMHLVDQEVARDL